MKTITKRLIAALCCVVLLVTSLYISEPQEAEAADAHGTMSITGIDPGFKTTGHGGNGYLNISYSGTFQTGYEFSGGIHFLDAAFAEEYITFGGGMTYEDLTEGMTIAYVALSNVLQFNWGNRTKAFEAGWSFTIAKGALLPYVTTSGATAKIALDKEYTFTFLAGNDNWDNNVSWKGYDITTYSLSNALFGNGKSDPCTAANISFTFEDGVTPVESSMTMQDNDMYADYIDVEGKEFSALTDAGVRMILHIGANAIQINQWGDLRADMHTGDQIIFREGMPIYFTDTSGNAWKALLDATYVFECMYDYNVNDAHDQVFDGVKIDSTNEFSMYTGSMTISATEGNFDFAWSAGSAQESAYLEENILPKYVTEDYLEFKGCTAEELTNKDAVKLMFIPTASVLQIEIYNKNVLEVGDQIILKKGMPITWNDGSNNLLGAVLDAEYTFTVTANDGTNVTFTYTLTDTYSLAGSIWSSSEDVNGTPYTYYAIQTATDQFSDANENVGVGRTEVAVCDPIKDGYISLSQHSEADLDADGSMLKWYTYSPTIYQGFRFYSNISFADGEVLMMKKGLPISYKTTDNKDKVAVLDKDYGFVYSAATGKFTYDASLGNVVEPVEPEVDTLTFKDATLDTYFEENTYYRTNFFYATEAELTADELQTQILTKEETAQYIDICGVDTATLISNGVEVKFIPLAGCFQVIWGTSLEWLMVGDEITFKEGMPVYYYLDGVEKKVVLEKTATFTVTGVDTTSATQSATFARYGEPAVFALDTSALCTGTASSATHQINVLDPVTKEMTVLDDMKDVQYLYLSDNMVANYIDFCGLTAEELESYGVNFVLIRDGESECLQIQWGSSASKMEIGDRLILKKGLPFTYSTTDGYMKTITLDKDYVFEVSTGNEDNAYLLYYTEVQIGGTWALTSGMAYSTAHHTDLGYYTNITLAASDLLNEVSALRTTLSTDVTSEYVAFGNIDEATYSSFGIQVLLVIDMNEGSTTLQLKWGSATEKMSEGNEIIFKEGMPIIATATDGTRRLYTLDADYAFVLEKSTNGANGYIITGVRQVATTEKGDIDEDYLLNVNDISLARKQLVGLIELNDERIADATENNEVDSRDLVRAKKDWNTAEPENYTTIYKNSGIPDTVTNGNAVTYEVNADIDANNYVRLTFKTSQNLYGTFNYTDDNGTSYTENFYLAKDEVQFEHFFDNYRDNGLNVTEKTLTSITLKNVGTEIATVLLNEVEISDRVMKTDDMLWAENGSLKIGVDLNMGGALGYLESQKWNPVEVIDTSNRETRIETDNSATSYDTYGNVNLINIYDLGRQIQQSFYIDVLDSEYTNATYNSTIWPYNPVQAGDKDGNQSQIVDYRQVDTDADGNIDMIYVKTRAMDWAQDNFTTESYMENWYRLSDNLLYTDNAFVDWAGWTETGVAKTQELPAFYAAPSLNYFVSGNDTSNRAVYGSWTKEDGFYAAGDALSNWYAWVNEDADDAFGLGIYIPGATACTAGRIKETRSFSLWNDINGVNKNADDAPVLNYGHTYIKDLYKHQYQNCFLHNTSYIAPTIAAVLEEYRSYEYTYVITADKLDQMATTFETIEESATVTNTEMSSWQ